MKWIEISGEIMATIDIFESIDFGIDCPSVEELTIAKEMNDRLHHAVAALPKAERELIGAIYFEGISASDYAKRLGITHRGVNKQRKKILLKLKTFLTLWEVIDP